MFFVVADLLFYFILDALGIKNGPGHGEVKFCRGSPVLIEVGSRCHGGEGAWVPIANKCVGYNQVDATIDSLLEGEAFDKLPERVRSFYCGASLFTENLIKLVFVVLACEVVGVWLRSYACIL